MTDTPRSISMARFFDYFKLFDGRIIGVLVKTGERIDMIHAQGKDNFLVLLEGESDLQKFNRWTPVLCPDQEHCPKCNCAVLVADYECGKCGYEMGVG